MRTSYELSLYKHVRLTCCCDLVVFGVCCVDTVSVRDTVVSEAFLRFFVETCGHYTDYVCTQQDGLRVFEVFCVFS